MTTTQYAKPLPQPDNESQGFWDGCKAHELRIRRCKVCGNYIHPPAPMCDNCNSMKDLEWTKVSGRGKVFTFIVVHQANLPGFAETVPYVVAQVELEEQKELTILSNIVGCDPKEVTVGMPVQVTFQDVSDEITLHKFKPAR